MLSYDWGSQKTVLTISNILKKAGYNVWIDVEKMGKFVLHIEIVYITIFTALQNDWSTRGVAYMELI